MDYGAITPFIMGAYGVSLLGIAGLVVWTLRKPKL